jgi:hypothetical protein
MRIEEYITLECLIACSFKLLSLKKNAVFWELCRVASVRMDV